MQGCQSSGRVVVCASTGRKTDKRPLGPVVHAGTYGYEDRQIVISDGQSTDVEEGVGSDEEHSLMDSPVSSAVVQGGRCVVQCSMRNEMVGGMKLHELNSFSPNLLSNPTTLYHPVCL